MTAPMPSLTPTPDRYGLLTDLYQLTMAACYCGEGLDQRPASFELLVRRLPEDYSYVIALGLAQAVDYLQHLQFTPEQIHWLQNTGIFQNAPDLFWERLTQARFTGDLWAVPEGTPLWPQEPFLRVDAPLWQAQLVETYLLNTLNYQSLIATRAARLRQVAGPDATLLEFGTRRAFSPQASLWAARAALAAGFDGTSNVLAAMELGVRPQGTMAHALVMALSALEGTEEQAFQAFHRYFPGAALLIDTYDSLGAARGLAVQVQQGKVIPAVRLDSGDLVGLSQAIRHLLPDTKIFASGDLDEAEISRLRGAGACVDGYGIGTKLVTGSPINGVYKLVEIDGVPVMKESEGKVTYPGRKQIFRRWDDQGQWQGDRLALMTEEPQLGEVPLLEQVIQAGKWLKSPESLQDISRRVTQNLGSLPDTIRSYPGMAPPSVDLSSELVALINKTRRTTIHLPQPPLSHV